MLISKVNHVIYLIIEYEALRKSLTIAAISNSGGQCYSTEIQSESHHR